MLKCVVSKINFLILVLLLCLPISGFGAAVNELCNSPLNNHEIVNVFKQSALNQLALEFGKNGIFVYEISIFTIDDVLTEVQAYARYPKPGQKDLARMRIKAWVSRCNGTTVIRGNTWLADGALKVLRYAEHELNGSGFLWGSKDAPLRFIVYLDSRCPHCHRLIEYAKKLVEQGEVLLDLRQVAYLEKKEEAVQDTLFSKTRLFVSKDSAIDDHLYLEMLAGNNSADELETNTREYQDALKLITQNTDTAEKLLHIVTVPGVLIQEKEHNNQYRKMGYWEINRIFQ